MQRNHAVNKSNTGLLSNKQKLHILPNTNELTTWITGKVVAKLTNFSILLTVYDQKYQSQ